MLDTLLIAYGNPDRRDDGVAYHIINRLRAKLGLAQQPILELEEGDLEPGLAVLYPATHPRAERRAPTL